MKAISLTQPWAQLVVEGYKRYETRSWGTRHSGLLAIHASKRFPREAQCLSQKEPFLTVLNRLPEDFPTGAIVGVVCLNRCIPTHHLTNSTIEGWESAFGNFSPGRWAWQLTRSLPVGPFPCRGALSIWDVPEDIASQINQILDINLIQKK